ncbi:MAG: DNA translocase FtsK, partial [Candidatus Methylomirabilis sp.]|nr:DNA translocase FtsK [Deltaproteobacteria bacterium]
LPFLGGDEYEFPDLDLLDLPEHGRVVIDKENLLAQARLLEKKFSDLGVTGKVVEVHPGPVITLYEFEPAAGVKVSRIMGLADDLALRLGGVSVRIIPTIPGKAVMGIEVPNSSREVVYLREILASEEFQESRSKLPLALGKDRSGRTMVADLAKMPHLLVAGSTGAGKSVCINAIIASLLYRYTPADANFIMVDPKRLELSIYDGIPHLLYPVVTDPKKAANALRWALKQMEERYELMADMGVRSLEAYNKGLEAFIEQRRMQEETVEGEEEEVEPLNHRRLSFIVIIIDELADLMMVAGKEVEDSITRLAQMARAAGIHLIVATQRPSVDVITGLIKANFPARIAFKVAQKTDSRTILDSNGAEALLGAGDMLFLPPGTSQLVRVHGAFVSDHDIQRMVEHLKKQGAPRYDATIVLDAAKEEGEFAEEDVDEKYDEAVALVSTMKQVSVSMIQRRMKIGYNRAARIIEMMEREGVVGPADGARPREVLVREI